MRKGARPAHPQKSALTTEVVASEAVVVAEASSVTTTEVPLEATEEAFRTGEEVAVEVVVEEATTEEVSTAAEAVATIKTAGVITTGITTTPTTEAAITGLPSNSHHHSSHRPHNHHHSSRRRHHPATVLLGTPQGPAATTKTATSLALVPIPAPPQ